MATSKGYKPSGHPLDPSPLQSRPQLSEFSFATHPNTLALGCIMADQAVQVDRHDLVMVGLNHSACSKAGDVLNEDLDELSEEENWSAMADEIATEFASSLENLVDFSETRDRALPKFEVCKEIVTRVHQVTAWSDMAKSWLASRQNLPNGDRSLHFLTASERLTGIVHDLRTTVRVPGTEGDPIDISD